jgi:hypothetical protein
VQTALALVTNGIQVNDYEVGLNQGREFLLPTNWWPSGVIKLAGEDAPSRWDVR